jgi:hypothetical protein
MVSDTFEYDGETYPITRTVRELVVDRIRDHGVVCLHDVDHERNQLVISNWQTVQLHDLLVDPIEDAGPRFERSVASVLESSIATDDIISSTGVEPLADG